MRRAGALSAVDRVWLRSDGAWDTVMGKRCMIRREELRESLDLLYRKYNRRSYVGTDPLVYLYGFDDIGDRELVALVASALAFGNVRQIMRSIESVLGVLGDSPVEFVMNSSPQKLGKIFYGFKHRWARGGDLACLLLGARHVIATYGSLEKCFADAFEGSHRDIMPALSVFTTEIARGGIARMGAAGGSIARGGTASGSCLVPSPCKGSACKRLNLFLRWMVRRDEVDPGGWRHVPAAKLIVPLDIHMHRWGRALGFTERRQADLKAAREVTDAFREIVPDDPVKYDFTLTRLAVVRGEERDAFFDTIGIDSAEITY